MNTITAIDTEYLRANRSIDTVLLNNGSLFKTMWIYNFEGIHFRVFQNLLAVLNFLYHSHEPDNSFTSESELDDFLLNINLRQLS
jgi:hypothetical protein